MERFGVLRFGMLCLACAGMVLPTPLLSAEFNAQPARGQVADPLSTILDVELGNGGLLSGQVIESAGAPPEGTRVSVRQMGLEVAATVTDRTGNFQLRGLRPGPCEIVAGRAYGTFRLWAPDTAPPLARRSALVLPAEGPIRANEGPIGYWLGKPWVIAGIVAVAVGVPVAIHNHRIDRVSSP